MKSKQSIVKTPIQLQLQKINLFNISQQKNIEQEYYIVRMLYEIVIHSPEIVNTSIFLSIFNEMLNFQQLDTLKMLPIFQNFSYRLWTNENFSIQIREKTNFYRIVSNWIVNFELRSGKLDSLFNQFELIESFMAKQTRTALERIVMIQQTYEDLKDLIGEEFWKQQEEIQVQKGLQQQLSKRVATSSSNKQQREENCSEATLNTIQKILSVLESVINPQFYRVKPMNKLYKNCTYGTLRFKNLSDFIKRSIFYILRQGSIPSHLQTELSKIALIYMQSLAPDQSSEIVNMLKHLMLRTNKAVRFALVIEYVQFYEYLEKMAYEEVIEQLENMIYFRQLIIGKKIVEESIKQIGNSMNDLNLSYHELYIKAGTTKKVFFSNEYNECIMKLDIIIEENDINIKVCHYDSISFEKKGQTNINKFIFESVGKLNEYDGSNAKGEKIYWKEEKSTSKKLELILQYQGLYSIEFDNNYSWVIPKNIKYRLELYQPIT